MKNIVCPVSMERIPENSARVTGMFVVLTVAGFLLTQSPWFLVFLVVDMFVRGFLPPRFSLFSTLARWFLKILVPPGPMIDRAPKMFAARIGFLFALASLVTGFFWPVVGVGLAVALAFFALLECVFNFCVGCAVYSWVVLPLARK